MAVRSVAIGSCKGQEHTLRGRFPWTPQCGGCMGDALGGASVRLNSRNQQFGQRQLGRNSTFARKPARAKGCLAGELECSRQSAHYRYRQSREVLWLNNSFKPACVAAEPAALDDSERFRPADDDKGVTAETVRKLCRKGRVTAAVEALEALVEAERRIPRSLLYAVLKKCAGKKDVVLGSRVHALVVRKGFQSDTFLGCHILRMYASHGRLQEAMDVFGAVSKPDAFIWSAIISAHVKHGKDQQAIELYLRMRRSGVKADGHVYVAALQACARASDLESGQQVHADVLASGVEPDLFVCNCLVSMYAKCGSLEEAQGVFDGLGQKDVVTWNALITGYSQQGMGEKALRLYSAMQEEGVIVPNSLTFVCLLQACANVGTRALETGKHLHGQVRERGHQADISVANSLVSMYAKCGSLEDAQRVFDGLGHRDVVAWNAMISGYSQQGMGQKALRLYSAMQEQEGMAAPNSVTFVCLLQACASVGAPALEKGRHLHIQIKERGHEGDAFVASSLVNMYAKCGSLEDAQRVFDGSSEKNVVMWTAMIAGYSQQGMGHEALRLYSAMQEGGMAVPNSVTYVCLLQACASIGTTALEKGRHLHLQIREQGHEGDVFVANSLVNMYAKCGSLADAQRVFDALGQKDVVTWTAMIAGYSQQGMGQEALCLYNAMQQEGMAVPNSITFVCLLQACASVGTPALEMGRHLHAQIRDRGLAADVFVANSLVNMYAKCGSLQDAESVFDGLRVRDVVTWTAMIAGYSQQGMGQEALCLHSAMQKEGMAVPDSVTYVCLLQACASVGTPALEMGKLLHAEIRERGHETDVFVANSLVTMYAKCGSLQTAQRVFDRLGRKDVVTWTAMIAGYSQQGKGQEALRLFSAMQEGGMAVPDSVTFVCLLQACASVGIQALDEGKQLHAQIKEGGHQADVFVANSLVSMYVKCGSLEDAQSVFDGLVQKDVVTWTAMIAGYAQQGMGQGALNLYGAMQEEGVAVPDSVTFICLLQACANVAALNLGRQLHAQIVQQGLQADEVIAGSLINMYGKSGSTVDAQRVFDALLDRDIVAWNALIAGYTIQGQSEVVFNLVQRMRDCGTQPDDVTLLSVLTVCSHAGLVNKGREYFEVMSREYGVAPTEDHYTCMVDLLCRAGQLDDALALVRTMPVLPTAAVWHTLLAASRKWSKVEVGRHAFDEAVKLDEKDAVAYVLMSNIYTASQMWEQAQELQARRTRIGAWKQPGQSWWTDDEGLVHSFLVGDEKHHPQSRARLQQEHTRT